MSMYSCMELARPNGINNVLKWCLLSCTISIMYCKNHLIAFTHIVCTHYNDVLQDSCWVYHCSYSVSHSPLSFLTCVNKNSSCWMMTTWFHSKYLRSPKKPGTRTRSVARSWKYLLNFVRSINLGEEDAYDNCVYVWGGGNVHVRMCIYRENVNMSMNQVVRRGWTSSLRS